MSSVEEEYLLHIRQNLGPVQEVPGEPHCAVSWSLRTMGPEPDVAKTVSPASFQQHTQIHIDLERKD